MNFKSSKMDFNYYPLPDSNIYVLELEDNLFNGEQLRKFNNTLENLMNKNPSKLVVDIKKEKFKIKAGGMEIIIGLVVQMNKEKKEMKFVYNRHKEDSFFRLVHLHKMDSMFEIYNSLEKAVESFG